MSLSKETLAQIENELRSLSRSAADSCRYNERTTVFGKPLFVYLSELADRIEAAADREVVVSKIATTTPGNNAAMREALKKIGAMEIPHNFQIERSDIVDACYDLTKAIKIANAALSEPPRNCDLPFEVSGVNLGAADKVWRTFKTKRKNAYFDVCGLLDCIEWMLGTATDGDKYANVGAVCRDCAIAAGFTPKNKTVGVWTDECGICHQKKPCTNLHHDWNPPKKGGAS